MHNSSILKIARNYVSLKQRFDVSALIARDSNENKGLSEKDTFIAVINATRTEKVPVKRCIEDILKTSKSNTTHFTSRANAIGIARNLFRGDPSRAPRRDKRVYRAAVNRGGVSLTDERRERFDARVTVVQRPL